MKKIESKEMFLENIQEQTMAVFSANWCPDCHFLKTYIDDLVNSNPDWNFIYIDRDQNVDLCIELGILGIPSFIGYNKGEELGRFVDKNRKTQAEVQTFMNGLVG